MAGSEKRQRSASIGVRLTSEERAELDRRADAAGLSLAAYLRACGLGDAGPRATRKPPVANQEMVRILGPLGTIGSNLNQLARAVNRGADPNGLADDIKAAVVAIAEIHEDATRALGRGRRDETPEQDSQSEPDGPDKPPAPDAPPEAGGPSGPGGQGAGP